jgi:predicted dienelactone hydrolase
VACSNLAHDTARLAQLGGPVSDYWEGIANTDNGANVPRYLTDILAEPASTLQFAMAVPDDRGLYRGFAGSNLPMVLLACYPTTDANIRLDYSLPDGQRIPRMQRAGEAPVFPAGSARLPLILYSHGLGGSPVGQDYLSTLAILASHGYIVVAPFHGDARITRIRLQDLNDLLYLTREFERYVELQAMRPLALSRTLDYLLTQPDWASRIDTSRIGGFGASMGGEAMLLAMGARLTQSFSTLSSRTVHNEPRIKAAAGYVPYAGMSFLPAFGDDQSGVDGVSKPWLAISGTADTTAPIRLAEQAINRMKGSRYLVALEGIEHRYLPEYANDVFTWAVTFLDAHVKEDSAALARLVRMGQVAGGLDDRVRVDYSAPSTLRGNEVLISEFRHAGTGHFINAIGQSEADLVAGFAQWSPTGYTFKAVLDGGFSSAACRFYYLGNGNNLLGGRDSLYLSPDPAVCNYGKARPAEWNNLGTQVSVTRADATGNCPSGTIAVNVLFNNLQSGAVNHRFVSSNAAREESLRGGWVNQGVAFCSPI